MITYQYLQLFIYTCFKQIETTANIKHFLFIQPPCCSLCLGEGVSIRPSRLGGVLSEESLL